MSTLPPPPPPPPPYDCEFLVDSRSCKAVFNGEGKKAREKNCANDSKNSCCYICEKRDLCRISCVYLDKTTEPAVGRSEFVAPALRSWENEEKDEPWVSSIFLERNEKIVTSWRGNREMAQKVAVRGSYGRARMQDVKERKNGFLVLTNQRLLFLEEHGILGKSYHQVLAIPLMKVGGISMGGSFSPFVSIADDFETHVFHLYGVGKDEFDDFRSLIADECRKRKEELEAEKRKERVQIVLDFSSLRDYMEKGGLVLQKTKCPECGAPVALPTTGNQMKCGHCGSIIYAQDIFEKVKSLIG